MKTYFSADYHLGHNNILKYDKRPFDSVEQMDHVILGNITKQLQKGDTLYYLGDFAMTRSLNTIEGYMKTLAYTEARLFFIKGNHDKKDMIRIYERYGTYLGEQKKIKVTDHMHEDGAQEIVLNHFAMRVWDKSHRGAWHLYGHSHDSLEREAWGKSMDCGVPSAYRIKGEYELFEYQDIRRIMNKRTIKVIDHHGQTERE